MKRVIKILLISMASLFVLALIVLIGLRLYFNDDRIKSIIVESIENSTVSDVYIGSFEIDGFLEINLDDLELKDKDSDSFWLTISDIEIAVKPFGLFKGDIHISEFTINEVYVNYAHLPEFVFEAGEEKRASKPMELPLDFRMDSFELDNLVISGPEADLGLDFSMSNVFFSSPDDFKATYSLNTYEGNIHYHSKEFAATGIMDLSADGSVSSAENSGQIFKVSFSDIMVMAGHSLNVNNLFINLNTTAKLAQNKIAIDELSFFVNNELVVSFNGNINVEESPDLSLRADLKSWDLNRFDPLLMNLEIPVKLEGAVSLEELSLNGSPTSFSYSFTLGLTDIGAEYDNTISLRGLNGDIYSSGDPETIVFGSSLIADSVTGNADTLKLFGIYNLSSAIESEITSSDIYFNLTAGVADFFGGEFDIFAFTESSKIDGDLRIENVNLSRAVSGFLEDESIDFSGLVDMGMELSGQLDSIQSNFTASLADLKIRMEEDSVFIPLQEFSFSASTVIGKESVNSRFFYDVQENISGGGELFFPLKPSTLDSIIMSYNMSLDNSALPAYLPAAILDALGTVELSGGSVIDGRFTSPADTFMFTGSSKLTIEPTDILISDFQSVLFSLISVSELEVSRRGISLFSESGIEDIVNENYSELDFSGITIQGEIISLSDTSWRITNMTLTIPSLKSQFNLLGDFGYSEEAPFSNITVYFEFNSDEPVEIGYEFFLNGTLKAEFNTAATDTLLEFSGFAEFGDVEIESRGVFKCSRINGDLPFAGKINLNDSLFTAEGKSENLSGSGYQRARLGNMLAGEYGRLRIGRIDADPFYIFDVNIDAGFRNGLFEVPYLTGELLGGNFYGLLRADLSDINLMREIPNYEALGYKLDIELSNLDFNQLIYSMGPFEQRADFAADAHFIGSGIIAPEEDYSIAGSFHITRMGPGVALRVLEVLDPENSNPGIMQTKALLDRKLLGFIDLSYKPRNFSFELKHGSLYPRLYMDQPFFADFVPLLKVPMPVEYGRIPVKSLLANIKEESW